MEAIEQSCDVYFYELGLKVGIDNIALMMKNANFLNTKKNYRSYMSFLFIWATIISYSRIYLGVHFPTDIIFGAIYGPVSYTHLTLPTKA